MMPAQIRSFETRIVIFFVALLAAVQVVAFLVVNAATESISTRELASQISVGERVFARMLEQNNRQFAQAGAALAANAEFHKAILARNSGAILSALGSHHAYAGQDAIMVVDHNNRLLADTLHDHRLDQPFPFPDLITVARKTGQASAVVMLDQQPYQLVVVPVSESLPIAWAVKGFRIDNQWAQEVHALTSLQVSFLSELDGHRWSVNGSTLPQAARDSLPQRMADVLRAQAADTPLSVGAQEYQTRAVTLGESGGKRVVAVWQQSLGTALAPFTELQKTLLDLAIASVFASIFGSIVIGQRLVHPINRLTAVARKAVNGDYSQRAEISRQDEIGELASSFNHMGEAIFTREQKILHLACQDTLTGLPNRALFNDRLDLTLKTAERNHTPAAILTMDLDRFKHINYTLGHPVGDRVLQEVGRRLQGLMRRSDTIARMGGDEFAMILPTGNIDQAREVAGKILDALDTPITIDSQTLDVRTSIGIAGYPEHGADPYTLVRHADAAMYVAKRANQGYAVFQPREDQARHDSLTLLGELRRAVELDELVLFFQPKVDLRTGVTTQAEALVRWMHPQRGLVPPGDFIPFAEQTGYIRTMTRWIIRRAIRQCGEWQARGINVVISVNICARDLLDPDLPDMVAADLKQRGVDPRWLSMEITENGVMEDPGKSLDTLRRLDQLGIKLAIDDYGTGYSSLSYVKKLPVIELKIDQSFVRDMTTDADDAMIVKSTIELGHNMGLQVVAEGVEDLAIWALLRHMDCDLAQGYCISKPLPAEQFEHWLAANPVFGDPTIPPARLAWRHHPARTAKLQGLPRPHPLTSA